MNNPAERGGKHGASEHGWGDVSARLRANRNSHILSVGCNRYNPFDKSFHSTVYGKIVKCFTTAILFPSFYPTDTPASICKGIHKMFIAIW